jgi:uracil-DNA glycosylase
MNEEFSKLIADVKEQVFYLQELGVETLDVSLPEIAIKTDLEITRRLPEIGKPKTEKFEKYVPTESILKSVAQLSATDETRTPRPSRRGLLENSRLSNLPEIPKRNLNNLPEKLPMTKNETSETPKLTGDFSQPLAESNETIEQIRGDIGNCTRCPLHAERTNIAHSTGSFQADLMFVGEAPGAEEDAQGAPFVGRAGKLLTKIIEGIQLKREDVFIGNINRCRPPGNRQPTADESAVCKPFLLREIAVVKPKVIVVLGNTATQNLLETKVGITKLRGNFQDYYGVKVMPTFHPAYLLRDPRKKREVWEDMKKVRDEINKIK